MKDFQNRWKPDRTNSLIAMFMGLDDLRPQPPVHEKRRGLSESYIRNAAFIGLRQGSLFSVGRSCSTNIELVNSRPRSARKGLRNSVSLFEASYKSRKPISKNDEHCAKQKLEHDSLHQGENASPRHSCIVCSRNMSMIPQHERCRSKFEVVLEKGYSNCGHRPRSILDQTSLANESKKQNLPRWNMAKRVREFGASRRNQNLNQTLALADRISKARNLYMKPGKTGSCDPARSSDSSSLDIRDDESLKSQPVSEFDAVKDILSLKRYDPIAVDNKSKEQETVQKGTLEFKSWRGSKQFQASPGVDEIMSPDSRVSELSSCSFSCFGSAFNDPEAYILGIRDEMDNSFENGNGKDYKPSAAVGYSSKISGDESELFSGTILEEGGQFSSVEEVFVREASLNEYFEEESPYSNFSRIGPPESPENSKRTSEQSPDSVLEPYNIKNSSSYECFDRTGLQLKLESLNFEPEDLYSEGSVMVISDDDDAEEQFGDLSQDSKKVKRWIGDGESRNFSYMVDVLDESGFCGMNSYMDFKMWHSLECPISPSVFEVLEKKYGKQTSWQNSERQLLFDRINSGLVEIFNPIVNFHAGTKSVCRRFSASFRNNEVVDELWMKLVIQEKEKSKELCKWLELEEDIDIICRELEASLFNELAMEFW